MKRMSKLLALVLTLVMALSLVNTAFAEGSTGGKITITGNTTNPRTYDVYKMFDVEVVSSNGIDQDGAKYKYKVTSEWTGFNPDTEGYESLEPYFKVINHYVHWQKNTTSAADGAAIAELAKKYLNANPAITAVSSITVGQTGQVNEDGYYLLVPSDNSVCGVLAVVGGESHTISEKSVAPGMPKVEKKVLEDSTNTYGNVNDVDIGQDIVFQTTITAGAGASNYVLHDMMDEHLVWDDSGRGFVTRDGNELNRGTDFIVDDKPTDGCTFHIIFDKRVTDTLHENATLVVNYYAKLKGDADANTAHNNTTWLTHTEQNIPTDKSSTSTYTYAVTVTKTDGKDPLPGAGFVLKDNVNKYYRWVPASESVEKPYDHVEWVDNIDHATVHTTTVENNCVVTFKGVDAENFTVIEKVVPGGYTGIGESPVTTKPSENGSNDDLGKVTVINTLGSALPETGGMGTTLFYVAGGLLVAAAVVLLALKKRKAE